jgi:hypothetical protein
MLPSSRSGTLLHQRVQPIPWKKKVSSMNLSSTAHVQRDQTTPTEERHAGPHPGIMATIYVVLFLAGLIVVSAFVTKPSFPAPDAGSNAIVTYFQMHPSPVRISAFLSFGAVIALAILVASIVSRLRFFGIRAAWVDITLVVGLVTALDQAGSHLCEWVLTWPGITQDAPLTLAFYYLLYAFGGPGFSVSMGLLVGGISIIAWQWSLLPKWLVWCGLVIAVIGILSWLNLLLPASPLVPLTIPLTRFPAFAWLIVTGFVLPKTLPARKA